MAAAGVWLAVGGGWLTHLLDCLYLVSHSAKLHCLHCIALPACLQVYGWLGVEPPRGVLLHGPPGCGKAALANAIANECGVPFLRVSAPEVVSGMSGESEAKIRQLFQEAASLAPCIVFIGGQRFGRGEREGPGFA